MDDHQGTRLLCVAVAVVVVLIGLVPPAGGQPHCCAPRSYSIFSETFSNFPNYPKVGMSHDAYDEQRGMYSRVLYGNDTYELYSLPEAVYIVNMTNDPQCKKTTCGGPCFYPLCTNTTNWFYNGLITVGVEKAGQWTNNFGSLDMQMVPLVHDRCIPVAYTSVFGTVESKLQYLFTWWRNIKEETFPPTTFQPPAICHGLEDSTTALQTSHPRLMSFVHARALHQPATRR